MALENRFLSNLLLVVSVNLLIKPLYIFGIDRTVQNTVGPEEYGLYFALLNLVYLFQIFNDLGIQNFNHSVYSKFDYLIPKYLPRILGTKFLLSLVFLLIIVLSGLLLGYTGLSVRMILLLAFNQVLASYLIFFRTNLSARGYYSLDSVLSVLDKSIMILVVGYLLWFVPSGDFNIFRFILAQTLSFVLAVTVAIFLLRYYRVVSLRKIRIDWKYSRWILRKSFPYALVLLLMTLYTRMDGVMLERLLTDGREQAGIYAASYRILDAFAMLGLLFAGLLLPMFSKEIAAKSNQIHSLVKVATSIIWAISVAVVASCVAFADPIMQWLYVDADSYYSEVFRWVMGSYVAICLAYIYGTLLTANESMTSIESTNT